MPHRWKQMKHEPKGVLYDFITCCMREENMPQHKYRPSSWVKEMGIKLEGTGKEYDQPRLF
jgi:hypothetical protein